MRVEVTDDRVGGVAELAHVQQIRVRIVFGTPGHRRPPQHDHAIAGVGPANDALDLAALDVHAGDEHGVGPAEVRVAGGGDVLVDEPHLPALRQVRGDHQQALGRHERPHAPAEEGVGVLERAERRRIAWRDAEDVA